MSCINGSLVCQDMFLDLYIMMMALLCLDGLQSSKLNFLLERRVVLKPLYGYILFQIQLRSLQRNLSFEAFLELYDEPLTLGVMPKITYKRFLEFIASFSLSLYFFEPFLESWQPDLDVPLFYNIILKTVLDKPNLSLLQSNQSRK